MTERNPLRAAWFEDCALEWGGAAQNTFKAPGLAQRATLMLEKVLIHNPKVVAESEKEEHCCKRPFMSSRTGVLITNRSLKSLNAALTGSEEKPAFIWESNNAASAPVMVSPKEPHWLYCPLRPWGDTAVSFHYPGPRLIVGELQSKWPLCFHKETMMNQPKESAKGRWWNSRERSSQGTTVKKRKAEKPNTHPLH